MSLPGRFQIIVNGKPIARPQENGEPTFQAHSRGPPAIFELHNGHLYCEDWAMGRVLAEDRSPLPKMVMWKKKFEAQDLQPVHVEEFGEKPELRFSGAGLAFIEDKLYAPLQPLSSNTYDHTYQRTRDPVRSPIDKLLQTQLHEPERVSVIRPAAKLIMFPSSSSGAAPPIRSQPAIEPQSDASGAPRPNHPTESSQSTQIPNIILVDLEIPTWLREHMLRMKTRPTVGRAAAWKLQAFDYFKSGRRDELPFYLYGIQSQLFDAWVREEQTSEAASSTIKREPDAAQDQPPVKKTKRSTTPVKSEPTSEGSMPLTPPSKPLGNLKGKYAIETFFRCCADEDLQAHNKSCSIVLSPGDNNTMRGYFNMGHKMDYRALILFDEYPIEASSSKMEFKWRGKKLSNDVMEFRGDGNLGWMKFLGDGKVEACFDKFDIRLVAQKGRGIGERGKHSAPVFWENWHNLD
ncbi:hypothetical protein F53441_6440 [Fusarium austroafricanum]|uniref:Uncharacterized protein n=1 Tax=Fusarium austroafricanum TaxID=2364996 RepID=A0A8H4KHU7_9HYPO|nr:hypothetical protein F53441_6440 [Fusarium austroafricanum]